MLDIPNRDKVRAVWRKVAAGNVTGLSESEMQIAAILQEHASRNPDPLTAAERQSDRHSDYDYESKKSPDPFFHVAVHFAVEQQFATNNPNEARQLFRAARRHFYDHHEALHIVMAVFEPLLLEARQAGLPLSRETYRSRLKYERKEFTWKLRDADDDGFAVRRKQGRYDPEDLDALDSRKAGEKLDELVDQVDGGGEAVPIRSTAGGIAVLITLSEYLSHRSFDLDFLDELEDEEKSGGGADVLQFPGNDDKRS